MYEIRTAKGTVQYTFTMYRDASDWMKENGYDKFPKESTLTQELWQDSWGVIRYLVKV
jgi:hypothetical protein